MPYRRQYRSSRRRRTYRRRATPRSQMSYGQMAMKALSIAGRVASIVNSELKHYDETNTVTPDTTTGSVVSIVRGMSQGDTNNTFEGNSFLVKSIFIRGSVVLNASATSSRVRYLLVKDTRPQAAVPAITDVLSAATIIAPLNIDDQIKRFKVLYDRTFNVSNVSGAMPEITFKGFKKQNSHIKWNDSQVPVLNDYLLVCLSDEVTNTPTVTTISRVRYYDN